MQSKKDNGEGPGARRRAIVELLARGPIASQEELGERLLARGFDATQATLSRDLRGLGVVKGPLGYQLPTPAQGGDGAPPEVRLALAVVTWVSSIRVAGHLLVVRTPPGGASAFGLALDQAGNSDVVGTVAGDDTVLVVAPTPAGARRLAGHLERLQQRSAR